MLQKTDDNHFMLDDRAYNTFKKLVQVILPAIASLYFGLANIWGLPAAEEVVGTLALITTFLGLCLGISSVRYDASSAPYDGRMIVTVPENGPKVFSLEFDGDPAEIENKQSIRFKVDPHDPGDIATTEDLL